MRLCAEVRPVLRAEPTIHHTLTLAAMALATASLALTRKEELNGK